MNTGCHNTVGQVAYTAERSLFRLIEPVILGPGCHPSESVRVISLACTQPLYLVMHPHLQRETQSEKEGVCSGMALLLKRRTTSKESLILATRSNLPELLMGPILHTVSAGVTDIT